MGWEKKKRNKTSVKKKKIEEFKKFKSREIVDNTPRKLFIPLKIPSV